MVLCGKTVAATNLYIYHDVGRDVVVFQTGNKLISYFRSDASLRSQRSDKASNLWAFSLATLVMFYTGRANTMTFGGRANALPLDWRVVLCIVAKLCKISQWCVYRLNTNVRSTFLPGPMFI